MGHGSETTVGVCLSGSLRSFAQPCVSNSIVENVILPLDADVYAFINVPTASTVRADREKAVTAAEALPEVRRLLQKTRLKALEIVVHNASAKPDCNTKGFEQSIGLLQCGRAMSGAYDWIARIRPDASFQWRLTALPTMPHTAVAIAGHVSECGCGTAPKPAQTPAGTCHFGQTCGCMSDTFALLWGRKAQDAYLIGYSQDWCHRHRVAGVPQSVPGGKDPEASAPECKLGYSLATRGVAAADLRFVSRRDTHPLTIRTVCTVAQLGASTHPWEITPDALRTLPPGPWDLNARVESCVLPLATRQAALRHQCDADEKPEQRGRGGGSVRVETAMWRGGTPVAPARSASGSLRGSLRAAARS